MNFRLYAAIIIAIWLIFPYSSFSQKNDSDPKITGQAPSPLKTNEGTPIRIELSNLLVSDPDPSPVYPVGFSLEVSNGKDYKVQGGTVTPDKNFVGRLSVPVRVDDGKNESDRFNVQIDVVGTKNVAPSITGQSPLQVNQGSTLIIEFSHLQVTDPDNNYPTGFTLKVFDGNNYSVSGNKITPSANFTGNLKVPVSVSDGQDESKRFDLKVEVVKKQNTSPTITGQTPLIVDQAIALTIDFTHLQVTDPDNNYPTGFTLKVFDGNNYNVSGNKITPSANFTGNLKVPVSVNDGQNESNRFDLKVEVLKPENKAPQITGQENLKTNEDESFDLHLSDLKVSDPDNEFPKDFSLKISEGSNYTVAGATVTPAKNFTGTLSVQVRVNDGKNDSPPFDAKVTVSPINDAPVITGQVALNTNENTPIVMQLSHLIVQDPDNKYPNDFTLKILNGEHYSTASNVVNPATGYAGVLNVSVTVNDGKVNSAVYKLKIDVVPTTANTPPVITGQKQISITQNSGFAIQLSHLLVSDPDNEYPHGFTLKVYSGPDYSLNGSTITPNANIVNRTISITVTVNDGEIDSQPFALKISVTPITAKPKINGQKELSMAEDSIMVINLSDLYVTDADNPNYPNGFTLTVLPGTSDVYSATGTSITPALNLTGFIEVGVTVSDGVQASDVFKLVILVTPVNDPPELFGFETNKLNYVPGDEPVTLAEAVEIEDVDSDHMILAEIGFRATNFNPVNDVLVFPDTPSNIRAVVDADGKLFLLGYATKQQYLEVLRTIQYKYRLTQDENGNPDKILFGPRTIYVCVFDGQVMSRVYEKEINMEVDLTLKIPSAFTPNGDNVNDTWRLGFTNSDGLNNTIIRVYDKRGQLLYESKGFEKGWDGLANGQVLPVDTYYYTIDFNLSFMKKTYKGAVTLLH